jgi:hypothetical protein
MLSMAIYGYLWLSMAIYGYLVRALSSRQSKDLLDPTVDPNAGERW